MAKKMMLKKILIGSTIAVTLLGGSALGILKMTDSPIFGQTNQTQTESHLTETGSLAVTDNGGANNAGDVNETNDSGELNEADDINDADDVYDTSDDVAAQTSGNILELNAGETDTEVGANEPTNVQDQEKNLSDGGHEDQGENTDHLFEGVE